MCAMLIAIFNRYVHAYIFCRFQSVVKFVVSGVKMCDVNEKKKNETTENELAK